MASPSTDARAAIARIALGDIVRRSARVRPARVAVVEGARRTTYAALDAASERVGEYLRDQGLQGAHVGMLCLNSTDMLVAEYGIHKAGCVWVPVNVQLAPETIAYVLGNAEVKALFVDAALLAKPALREALERLGVPMIVIGDGASGPGIVPFAQAAGRPPSAPLELPIDQEALALIMYTSGTTGRPKGAMHSHLSVFSGAFSVAQTFGFSEGEVISCVLPLFHCAQHVMSMACFIAGGTAVVLKGFDPAAVLDAIEREGMTFFFGIPAMFAALVAHPSRKGRKLSSLRRCMYAMAPIPKALLDTVRAEICADLWLGTGQTEMYPPTMCYRPGDFPQKVGNYWGVSVSNVETAVMDDEGRLLPPGRVGEIVHRGPNAFLGYYKDPAATAAAQRFGWHHTGDLGKVDEDGQMLFLDRKKDMIKTGGENVPSIRVEEALLGHPAVASAAVVGLPHPRWAEAVTAFVVLKPGVGCTEAELVGHCRERLAGFEVPKAIVFLDALPLTATGKLQKHLLRDGHRGHFDAAAKAPPRA